MSNSKETSKSLSINERLIVNLTRIYEEEGYINLKLEDKVCSEFLDGNVDENGKIRDKSQALLNRATRINDKELAWFWNLLAILQLVFYVAVFYSFCHIFNPKEKLLYIDPLFWGAVVSFIWIFICIISNISKLFLGKSFLWYLSLWFFGKLLRFFMPIYNTAKSFNFINRIQPESAESNNEFLKEHPESPKSNNEFLKENIFKKTKDYFNNDPSYIYYHFSIIRFISCISMLIGIVYTSYCFSSVEHEYTFYKGDAIFLRECTYNRIIESIHVFEPEFAKPFEEYHTKILDSSDHQDINTVKNCRTDIEDDYPRIFSGNKSLNHKCYAYFLWFLPMMVFLFNMINFGIVLLLYSCYLKKPAVIFTKGTPEGEYFNRKIRELESQYRQYMKRQYIGPYSSDNEFQFDSKLASVQFSEDNYMLSCTTSDFLANIRDIEKRDCKICPERIIFVCDISYQVPEGFSEMLKKVSETQSNLGLEKPSKFVFILTFNQAFKDSYSKNKDSLLKILAEWNSTFKNFEDSNISYELTKRTDDNFNGLFDPSDENDWKFLYGAVKRTKTIGMSFDVAWESLYFVQEEKRIATEEAERKAKEKAEARARAEAKAKEEADTKARAEAKTKEEADAKAKAEAKAKEEADAKAKAEAKAKEEAEAKARAEAKAKEEAEAKARAEAEAKTKAEADAKARAEAKAKEDAEAKARAEAKAKEEADAKNQSTPPITVIHKSLVFVQELDEYFFINSFKNRFKSDYSRIFVSNGFDIPDIFEDNTDFDKIQYDTIVILISEDYRFETGPQGALQVIVEDVVDRNYLSDDPIQIDFVISYSEEYGQPKNVKSFKELIEQFADRFSPEYKERIDLQMEPSLFCYSDETKDNWNTLRRLLCPFSNLSDVGISETKRKELFEKSVQTVSNYCKNVFEAQHILSDEDEISFLEKMTQDIHKIYESASGDSFNRFINSANNFISALPEKIDNLKNTARDAQVLKSLGRIVSLCKELDLGKMWKDGIIGSAVGGGLFSIASFAVFSSLTGGGSILALAFSGGMGVLGAIGGGVSGAISCNKEKLREIVKEVKELVKLKRDDTEFQSFSDLKQNQITLSEMLLSSGLFTILLYDNPEKLGNRIVQSIKTLMEPVNQSRINSIDEVKTVLTTVQAKWEKYYFEA